MRIEFLKHRKRGLKRQVTINMGYGQAILLYAIYIMPFVLTNPGESINEFIVDSPGTHTLCFLTLPVVKGNFLNMLIRRSRQI